MKYLDTFKRTVTLRNIQAARNLTPADLAVIFYAGAERGYCIAPMGFNGSQMLKMGYIERCEENSFTVTHEGRAIYKLIESDLKGYL